MTHRGPLFGLVARRPGDDPAHGLEGRLPDIALDRAEAAGRTVLVASDWQAPGEAPLWGSGILAGAGTPQDADAFLESAIAAPARQDRGVGGSFVLAKVAGGTLHLACDVPGTRTIHYRVAEDWVAFSSDERLLLALLPERRVRRGGLHEHFHLSCPLQPLTLFEGVRQVTGGLRAEIDLETGQTRHHRYLDLAAWVDPDAYAARRDAGVDDIERELEERLEAAILASLAGREEVGVLLSGGVDSSLVAAIASRHAKVRAVTVDLKGGETEVHHAARVADHLGIELVTVPFGASEMRGHFTEAVWNLGTPIGVENAVALQWAAKEGAFEGLELLLDGEGADALFCGSTSLFKSSMMRYLAQRSLPVGERGVDKAVGKLRARLDWLGLKTSVETQRHGLAVGLGARLAEIEDVVERLKGAFAHMPSEAERDIAALTLAEFYDYLVPLMKRIDAAASVAGCHLVLPFLEEDFFRFAQDVPMAMKVRADWKKAKPQTKWVLKRVAAKLVPPEVVYRPKVGFGIPGGAWAGRMPEAWLDDPWTAGAFDMEPGQFRRYAKRLDGSRDAMFLVGFEAWGRLFDRQEDRDAVREGYLSAWEEG